MRPEHERRIAERELAARIKTRASLGAFSFTEKSTLNTAGECLLAGRREEARQALQQVRAMAHLKAELIEGYLSQIAMMEMEEAEK